MAIPTTIDEKEVRRLSEILQRIATRPDLSTEEFEALETAMIALMSMVISNSLKSSYLKIASAHNGAIPDNVRKDLVEHGIDLDAIESDL